MLQLMGLTLSPCLLQVLTMFTNRVVGKLNPLLRNIAAEPGELSADGAESATCGG